MGRADPSEAATLDRDDIEAFRDLGVTVSDELVTEEAEDAMQIWEGHWPAMTAFLAAETQWRFVATMASIERTGLDYSALDVLLRRRGCADSVFEEIQIIEQSALNAFAETEH